MKLPGRPFFAQLFLPAPAVVLLTCAAVWLAGRVAEFRCVAGAYAAGCARNRELAARAASSYRRVLARQEVLTVLARGTLSLREAAARFAELDREDRPCSWKHFCQLYPGITDEERYCRMVLTHVREQRDCRPALYALLPRLERELRELVRGSGREEADSRGGPSEQ